ncbi:MAG: GNAT family N-acetyltransferase [Algoriphagus sp.]|nr:GNAT family N-acetyltransferase [Algoriphagus sp.]
MMQLRLISKEELFKVQAIAHQTWPFTFGAILSAEQIAYMLNWMYDLALLESQVEKGHTFLIAEVQGTAIGFAGFELFYQEGTKAKLHKLYLLPSSHGKGTGKALLQEVANRARTAGQQSLTLNVNKDNQIAIDFYRSQGFVEIYKEVIDIGNGYVMDDAVMELML